MCFVLCFAFVDVKIEIISNYYTSNKFSFRAFLQCSAFLSVLYYLKDVYICILAPSHWACQHHHKIETLNLFLPVNSVSAMTHCQSKAHQVRQLNRVEFLLKWFWLNRYFQDTKTKFNFVLFRTGSFKEIFYKKLPQRNGSLIWIYYLILYYAG